MLKQSVNPDLPEKKRLLFYHLEKYIHHKNALIITGMRQVGKTTIMKQVFASLDKKNKIWFDFDNPLDQKIFEDIEYRNIHEALKKKSNTTNERLYVFIDEIQNFPEITKIIKFLIDHYNVKFIVTGSSNFYLINLFPESLSGRKFLYQLSPFSFQEYLYFIDKNKLEETINYDFNKTLSHRSIIEFKANDQHYDDYLRYGGFPEVVLTSDRETKKLILKNIFASFFEKDLRVLSDYSDIRELRDLILLLVPRVGSMLDITKLSAELGVNRAKIYSYLELLQGNFFVRLLPKFSRSIDRSIAGGKKVYFTDNGILNIIGNVNDSQLLENSAVNQLANYGAISFYNKRNTAEIDIIFEKEYAFEVKLNGTHADLVKTERISAKIGIKKYYVISRKYKDEKGMIFPMFL